MINKKQTGLIIVLTHDTVIKWDDRIITHCTFVTDVKKNNNVYEIMVIKNKKDKHFTRNFKPLLMLIPALTVPEGLELIS